MTDEKPKKDSNPLARVDADLAKDYQRPSHELIYESVMRGGGEPFGAPYEVGTPTLMERIVKLWNQRGFFRFETFEKVPHRRRRNKFTRYGASRFVGRARQAPNPEREPNDSDL